MSTAEGKTLSLDVPTESLDSALWHCSHVVVALAAEICQAAACAAELARIELCVNQCVYKIAEDLRASGEKRTVDDVKRRIEAHPEYEELQTRIIETKRHLACAQGQVEARRHQISLLAEIVRLYGGMPAECGTAAPASSKGI